MKWGLLIYDADDKSLWKKVEDAAKRFQAKFGTMPNAAYVNPRDLAHEQAERPAASAIHVEAKQTIMFNYVWLGVRESTPVMSGATAE